LAIDKTRAQRKKAIRALITRLLVSAMLGTLIVAAFYLYSFLTTSPRLAVADVEFHGLSRLSHAEVERLVADVKGQNILLVRLDQCAARFHDHPRVKYVEFRRVLPDRVVCTVQEREPVALVAGRRLYEVDNEGMIMTADDLTGMLDLPVITGVSDGAIREGKPCPDAGLGEALATLRLCKQFGGPFAEDISELSVGKGGINIVSLKEGMVLLLGNSQLERRLKKFFLMKNTIAKRDQSRKLIDLRFEDQIVLRGQI
jgi:cell division protein FtsQ